MLHTLRIRVTRGRGPRAIQLSHAPRPLAPAAE